MTVKEANKWLDKVQNMLHSLYCIQAKCHENPELWEHFAESCNLNISYKEFTYIIIESLCSYKNLMREKIGNAKID